MKIPKIEERICSVMSYIASVCNGRKRIVRLYSIMFQFKCEIENIYCLLVS